MNNYSLAVNLYQSQHAPKMHTKLYSSTNVLHYITQPVWNKEPDEYCSNKLKMAYTNRPVNKGHLPFLLSFLS
jgi:hypothetical protein